MLTAKGIGGGAAKVTNGILQEMYAAEGEIPAGTFVEIVKSINLDSSNMSISVENQLAIAYDSFDYAIGLSENKFLVYKNGSGVTVCSMDSNQVKIGTFTRVSDFGCFIKYSKNMVFLLHKSSSNSNNLNARICKIETDDTVSVSNTIAIANFSDSLEVSKVTGCITESGKLAFLCHRTSFFDKKYAIAVGLATFDNTSLSPEWNVIINRASEYGDITCPKVIPLSGDRFIAAYQDVDNRTSKMHIIKEETAVLGYSSTNKEDVFSYGNSDFFFIEGVLYHIHTTGNGKSARICVTPFSISGTTLTKQDSINLTDITTEETENGSRTITFMSHLAVEIMPKIFLLLVDKGWYKISGSGSYSRTDYKEGVLLYAIDESLLADNLQGRFIPLSELNFYGYSKVLSNSSFADGSTAHVWTELSGKLFFAINNAVNYSDKSKDFVELQVGNIVTTTQLSTNAIEGLTKTKCTKTQKGQVWLLNTQEGDYHDQTKDNQKNQQSKPNGLQQAKH